MKKEILSLLSYVADFFNFNFNLTYSLGVGMGASW